MSTIFAAVFQCISLFCGTIPASVSQVTPPLVAALATASIKATIQDDTTQLYIHSLNCCLFLCLCHSLFPPQAWPTVKRTFELYPGAAMPYNEHRISGKIASIFAMEHMNACGRGRGKCKEWAVRKCANKLLAKSFCAKCRRRWLSELHF